MARTTAKKIAGRTAAAAKRVTSSLTRKPASGSAKAVPAAKKPTSAKKASTKKAAPAKKPTAVPKKAATSAKKAAPTKKKPTTAKKASAKPASAKPASAKPASAKKAAPAKKPTAVPKKAGTAAKKAPATTTKKRSKRLAVKGDESPWTAKQLAEVRGDLNTDRDRLRSELNLAEEELAGLMRDAGDGAGNDQADVGSTTFERDHEMTLANNARVMLAQTERALERMDDGTYGLCERCGEAIGKMRLMAFPRATMCVPCKQREERR